MGLVNVTIPAEVPNYIKICKFVGHSGEFENFGNAHRCIKWYKPLEKNNKTWTSVLKVGSIS